MKKPPSPVTGDGGLLQLNAEGEPAGADRARLFYSSATTSIPGCQGLMSG